MNKALPATLVVMLALLASVLVAGRYGPLYSYVQAVKHEGSAQIAFGESGGAEASDPLFEWIARAADKQRIAPVDAVVDRVWKAIPGYNGREADVERTYARAKAMGLSAQSPPDKIPWVYREVPPKVGLSDFKTSPVYRGNPNKPMVGLMINVAWGNEHLPAMLDTLDRERAKATFFLDGSWLSKNEETAREILRRGHELSNHAYTHKNMSTLSDDRQREEIARTEALLKDKLGVRNRLFAPPSGDFDGRTVRIASEFGLTTVLWTLDTIDWKLPPPDGVVAKVSARIQAGNLILMHPTTTSKAALQGMIRAIRAKGLEPGTVSETLSPNRRDPGPSGAR
ncbi:polysaccharide deacetylase family protein [Cohnella sp. REN36]|uniref:polysaccharide deacetylase family protein n=1 Tax=Cohnella sp. REN36 TaxID=2887347 RepID=UPI001D14010B|nr:polysaccharide deacetylase family protein [Cohnella sp. REN36]MCC3371822.1 polysaccharide deacetylase family protein [Cohnella sp. REN36]